MAFFAIFTAILDFSHIKSILIFFNITFIRSKFCKKEMPLKKIRGICNFYGEKEWRRNVSENWLHDYNTRFL